jgi:hypothetical protein
MASASTFSALLVFRFVIGRILSCCESTSCLTSALLRVSTVNVLPWDTVRDRQLVCQRGDGEAGKYLHGVSRLSVRYFHKWRVSRYVGQLGWCPRGLYKPWVQELWLQSALTVILRQYMRSSMATLAFRDGNVGFQAFLVYHWQTYPALRVVYSGWYFDGSYRSGGVAYNAWLVSLAVWPALYRTNSCEDLPHNTRPSRIFSAKQLEIAQERTKRAGRKPPTKLTKKKVYFLLRSVVCMFDLHSQVSGFFKTWHFYVLCLCTLLLFRHCHLLTRELAHISSVHLRMYYATLLPSLS